MTTANNLAEYIVNDLFPWMAQDRKNLFEDQWYRNYDAFRGRYNSSYLKKWKATEGSSWRSKVFVRLTKQKVVTGFNQVTALMLQGGKLPWSVSATPVPEDSPGSLIDPADAAARALRMSRVIDDNFSECDAEGKYLQAVLEGSLYGLSWMRGPYLKEFESLGVDYGIPGLEGLYIPTETLARHGRYTMSRKKIWRPVVESPSVWNMFWDLEAEDHQSGHGVIMLEMMSKGRFLDLVRREGFSLPDGEEAFKSFEAKAGAGDETDSLGPLLKEYGTSRRGIPVFTFWGRVPQKYLKAYDLPVSGNDSAEREIYCVCARGSKPVVIRKPVLNPLPYRQIWLAKHQDLPHEPGGVGTPEDMEDTQMIVNGLTRAMMDNKNLSSALMTYMNPRLMAPGTSATTYPGKVWETAEGTEQLEQAIRFFSPPDVTGNTPQLIEMFKSQADDETGFGRIMDGSAGGVKKTAYEIGQVTESGNKMIGGICRNHDRGFIEPMVRAFYHYHMITHKDPSIKGDFTCVAKGFQSYKDKSVRGMKLFDLARFALSSELTAKYAKVQNFLFELARINDFNPEDLFMTDDEVDAKAVALMQQMAAAQGAGGME